ncbi:MAG TPA: aminotransferase class V-fold PLP-dependent enzyme, partial [Gemmatales bacterium]|nr:aminotransferase class V-fold PLP-dependent enzyme [Gemmatales bacterium]
TFGLLHSKWTAAQLSQRLAEQGIFTWAGNFYALPLTEALGLEPEGMLRIGFLHYNTLDEVERVVSALAQLA